MTSPTAPASLFSAVSSRPALVPGILLALGGLLFLAGGRLHPMINSSIGPMGSIEFYQAFAAHVRMSPHWEMIHNLILIGPVLWALGASGVDAVLPRSGAQLWALARMSLGIGASAWVVAFALDGNSAPAFAQAIANATDPAVLLDRTFGFQISARLVAYFGRLGWTMMTLALAAFGAGMLFTPRANVWKKLVGATGILVGLWTIVEVVRGDFTPGPFTSRYWMQTALGTGLWVIAFGATVATTARDRDRTSPARSV